MLSASARHIQTDLLHQHSLSLRDTHKVTQASSKAPICPTALFPRQEEKAVGKPAGVCQGDNTTLAVYIGNNSSTATPEPLTTQMQHPEHGRDPLSRAVYLLFVCTHSLCLIAAGLRGKISHLHPSKRDANA